VLDDLPHGTIDVPQTTILMANFPRSVRRRVEGLQGALEPLDSMARSPPIGTTTRGARRPYEELGEPATADSSGARTRTRVPSAPSKPCPCSSLR